MFQFQFKAGKFNLSYGQKSHQTITGNNILTQADVDRFVSVFVKGSQSEANMLKLFSSVPEVFAPIDLTADAVASAKWGLRKINNKEEVTNYKPWNDIYRKPNWQQGWFDLVYNAMVYYYVTGNRYFYPYVPESLTPKNRNISALWLLPPHYTTIYNKSSRPKIFTSTSSEDVIDKYVVDIYGEQVTLLPSQVTHETFIQLEHNHSYNGSCFKGISPLQAAEAPMSNIVAVYEARNVIYVKRGSLGYVVSLMSDAGGRVALTPKEKKELIDDHHKSYGLQHDKSPVTITSIPVEFIRTAMSIQELEPFKEVEASALAIYDVLKIPREMKAISEGATFENQKEAYARFYRGVAIPQAEALAETLTKVLRLDLEGYEIFASFDHVEALQENKKEKADVDWKTDQTCREQFMHGIITLNDWRIKFGMEEMTSTIYTQTVLEMNDEDLDKVLKIVKAKSISNEKTGGDNDNQ